MSTTPPRPQAPPRSHFPLFQPITTRWMDNDVYGHLNNVVYYSCFDTAVNRTLIEAGALDIHGGEVIGLVVHTQCHYFESVGFPQAVQVGLRVARLGGSSVSYELGLFADDAPLCAALGSFVHVYVDRATRRPVPLPEKLRAVLAPLCLPTPAAESPA
ncbi:acyl-CoA thioesterase [Rubrivivax rivuli]|uniref:Acyl-CoA thioesterase n=1 Tax=Rubrivivax rivuli TaxID=1862385 RepID=A0A437RH06_9BURK|nr:thioesterase family protein [Rubrivivax rivuli]RVU46056.1 acyl-CoA thioesterase [Rubrivivax rivuli]